MIKIIGLKKLFNDGDKKIIAVNDISLTFNEGKLTFITGKSGCGKTTLLNLLGLIEIPDEGKIFYNDKDILKLSLKEKAKFRNEELGYVFQMFYLEPDFTVLENVIMPLVISGVDNKKRIIRGKEVLDDVGLLDKANVKTSSLSGGEKQRVCIARALINNPNIILADEPTGNLDSENGKQILEILKKIAISGRIVIIVTHNEDDCKKYADVVYHLRDGCVVDENK